jgi:predicted outer membrane repeat protein
LTNGSGGALTTLSSRTWLINCQFSENTARHKGGALAIMQVPNLQAPNNFPKSLNAGVPYDIYAGYFNKYNANKNPNITEKNGVLSNINTNKIPAIDLIDEADAEPTFNFAADATKADYYRQAFDDARVAVYLGRVRNLSFENNKVQLAKVVTKVLPGTPPTFIVEDYTDLDDPTKAAEYPREYDNIAYGGAIYIGGDENDPKIREIEVGLGVNNSIRINNGATLIEFEEADSFIATGNKARNFQNQLASAGIVGSKGSKGGAIYLGSNTSLIVAGEFVSNVADAPWMLNEQSTSNRGYYASGGAIYAEKTRGRLQVRGGPTRDQDPNDNATTFVNNQAGVGGAIYVAANLNDNINYMSPIIGGSDVTIPTRDYGFYITFLENVAYSFGGAIYSARNFTITGAGGIDPLAQSLIGYGGKFPVLFENNSAGFAGGAIDLRLPISSDLLEINRAVDIRRAVFHGNKVGYSVFDNVDLKKEIRGGGAIYTMNGSLAIVKGVEFKANMVKNANGGAVAMINPQSNTERFFVTDIDVINYDPMSGMPTSYESIDEVFTTSSVLAGNPTNQYPPDVRMLTRFIENKIEYEEEFLNEVSGSGTTQIGAGSMGTNENLRGVSYIDAQNGFIVGDNGTIIKLTQNGTVWQFKRANTTKNLNKVYFLTQNVGYIIGRNAVILKTVDGGENWLKVYEDTPATDINLYDLVFTSSENGFAVGEGGRIMKTTNSGTTWAPINSGFENDFFGITFTSNYGFIVGRRGLIIRTTDQGLNWFSQVSGTLQDLTDVKFTASQTGYVIGTNGTLLRTGDAGNTWASLNSNTTENLNSFMFADQNTCYIAANNGIIVKTSNTGERWDPLPTNITTQNLGDVYFLSRQVGYAIGDLGTIIRTTNGGTDWEVVRQANMSTIDARRFHANGETTLPENGIGLGGAIYILDVASVDRARTRVDSVMFNRVRMQNNVSYTGAAIYSDNFDLKLLFNRSLITNNRAESNIGLVQNAITGPYLFVESLNHTFNKASSDLAGAIIYGEIQGPIPSTIGHWAGNSIFDNVARFLIRLPDAPNSKGVLVGNTGEGFGGTDTLRANYWGRTEVNVNMEVQNEHMVSKVVTETFFVDTDGERRLDFIFWQTLADRNNLESTLGNLLFQGPFESVTRYTYKPIPLLNTTDENTPDLVKSIPEKLLQSGRIYDLYDKGTDIKVADYAKRRLSPIEDFAVGIAPMVDRFMPVNTELPSYGKYVKRYARDPFIADSINEAYAFIYPELHKLQGEFMPAEDGTLYHPIGYPLFIESKIKYESGLAERYNLDPLTINETVFFIINETTGDFIRTNLKQMSTTSPLYRARVEIVPDSSNRYPNTNIRRTFEGLLNLGTNAPNGDPKLLKALLHNPYNEQRATLEGRKYEHFNTHFGGTATRLIQDLFINRSHWPASNKKPLGEYATFFAGERYRALPVDTGDVVRIVSRTVLWREGVNKALEDGLLIKITASTEPPVYTGDVRDVMNNVITNVDFSEYPWGSLEGRLDTTEITDWRNTIFVTEDRQYPAPALMYSNTIAAKARHGSGRFSTYNERYGDIQLEEPVKTPDGGGLSNAAGRDRILNVTARDNNNYYDPRALYAPDYYSYLNFDFVVDPNSGLKKWLMKEHIPASKEIDELKWGFKNPGPDDVFGFMILRGRPTNPYVVPGGEILTVRAHNFPPHYRTIDSLLAMNEQLKLAGKDTIDLRLDTLYKFMEVFDSYLHAPTYDVTNARYLQQDTIDLGKLYFRQYACRVYVTDSIPIFLDPDADNWQFPHPVFVETSIDGDELPLGEYIASVYPCRSKRDGRLMGNLTNKLRFQADFNTNDEIEDSWAEAQRWDFRYGRTAYGFLSVAKRQDDRNGNGGEDVIIEPIVERRPVWMDKKYINEFDKDNVVDAFASDFTLHGKLNIRIDATTALGLLTPPNQYNDALNLDTTFTVVVNDGHGGINSIEVPVMINVEPLILTTTLPPAKEDFDYNPQLIDDERMIKIFDANFYQDHLFYLAYDDVDARNAGLPADLILPDDFDRDPCFPEAGKHYLRNQQMNIDLKTTPTWLRINKESGVLYGTPGVKDAPRTIDLGNLEDVTVVVFDEDGLAAIKTFKLRVDSTNHCPGITAAPAAKCFDFGKRFEDIIYVYDRDFRRGRVPGDETDEVTIKVLPPGIKIEVMDDAGNWPQNPTDKITGTRTKDTVKVRISQDDFRPQADVDGRVRITFIVVDKYGCVDTLVYKIKFSEETDFVADLKIKNNKGAENLLQFGTGKFATSGSGTDGTNDYLGKLDSNYCEFELPPIPEDDIFDVRWTIPNSNGTYRNIFLTGSSDNPGEQRIYRGRLQSGGEAGHTSNHYPMTITWNTKQVPAVDDKERNESAGSWFIRDAYSSGAIFNYNMNTGQGNSTPDVAYNRTGDMISLTIFSDAITDFQILYNWTPTSVNEPVAGYSTQIQNVNPNPMNSLTNIYFSSSYRQNIKIEIVDALGQVVKVLTDESYGPNNYQLQWDGKDSRGNDCSSGSYTCRMVAGTVVTSTPIVIVK